MLYSIYYTLYGVLVYLTGKLYLKNYIYVRVDWTPSSLVRDLMSVDLEMSVGGPDPKIQRL